MSRAIAEKKIDVAWASLLYAIAMLSTLHHDKYIHVLDAVIFAPHLPPPVLGAAYPLYGLMYLLNFVLPSWVIQRLLFFAIFFLMAYGAAKLARRVLPESPGKQAAVLFASTFYVMNPFVYARFMMGQWAVLFGYALLPFVALAMLRFLQKPSLRSSMWLAGAFLAVSIVSIHSMLFAVLVALVLGVAHLFRQRQEQTQKQLLLYGKYALLIAVVWLAFSSYWLIPTLLGHGRTADTIAHITANDQAAYQTVPGELGLLGNVLALQGFWGDAKNLYLLPQDVYSWWLAPIVLLWALVALGAVFAWKKQRRRSVAFAVIGVSGAVFAIGNAGTVFVPLNNWLFVHVPLFSGYREPQKFAALIALAYLYFGAMGVLFLAERLHKTHFKHYIWLVLLLPLLCAPLLPWGGAGQLKVSDYPTGWYAANTYLAQHTSKDTKVLFLPWHLYMPFSFSGGVQANPAPNFFEMHIISSQDPELGNAHGYNPDATARAFQERLLPNMDKDPDLAAHLHELGIKYILLAKEYDYADYSYLNQRQGLQVVMESKSMLVYQVLGTNK